MWYYFAMKALQSTLAGAWYPGTEREIRATAVRWESSGVKDEDATPATPNVIILPHAEGCHVEVTTLIVPGHNDGDADISAIATYLASISPEIPLHVTRFFPRFHLTDIAPTPVATVRHLADVARQRLTRVQVGNC